MIQKSSSTPPPPNYSVLIDTLPSWTIILTFIFFFLSVFGCVGVLFFAPNYKHFVTEKAQRVTNDLGQVLNGEKSLIIPTPYLKKANQEITISLLFKENTELVSGLTREGIGMTILSIQGSADNTLFHNMTQHPYPITRSLNCEGESNSQLVPSSVLDTYSNYFCNPIVIYRDRYITYPFYRIELLLHHDNGLMQSLLRDDVLFYRIEYVNTDFTEFESTIRYLYSAISIIVFLFYGFILLKYQKYSYAKTEQKWILFLLLLLILFNNPLFIGDWMANDWLLPFLNVIFQATFIGFYLLFLMVITASANTHPKERTFYRFYLWKFILSLLFWSCLCMSMLYERFETFGDRVVYDYISMSDHSIFGLFRVLVMFFGAIATLYIFYQIFKALGGNDFVQLADKINKTYLRNSSITAPTASNATIHDQQAIESLKHKVAMNIISYSNTHQSSVRFKYFFILTFLVLLLLCANLFSFLYLNNANSSAQYLGVFPLFNFYGIMLAIYFIPSLKVDEKDASQSYISSGLFFNQQQSSHHSTITPVTPPSTHRLEEPPGGHDEDDHEDSKLHHAEIHTSRSEFHNRPMQTPNESSIPTATTATNNNEELIMIEEDSTNKVD
ncbi:hypothetical protein C9374_004270 [Naegleria lovaniensis]|uniref:Wntless-like transmembrane domain-containing protein n=1 Tax=Naegleria lovaniensis TaxID=51637 RepID=A0AA88KJ61_NAELO|nr:uncharacterized protein C9374_004270 [Naegleria lovaniensis]KAG2383599.1 hypothetical protein C9374_004270 [Naegleria lovaniensis]